MPVIERDRVEGLLAVERENLRVLRKLLESRREGTSTATGQQPTTDLGHVRSARPEK